MSGAPLASILAKFVEETDVDDLPKEIVEQARTYVLDTLGVAIAGSQSKSGKIMARVALSMGGRQESTVIRHKAKTSCLNAALANGTMAHSLELDDTHKDATLHPGAVILPCALAVAERERVDGEVFLSGVIVGYEVMVRIGEAFLGKQYNEGFHPTATCGVFGAAAAASKIMGLKQDAIVNGMGIAGTQAAGLEEWKSDGSWIKRMHPGKSAQSGILAAMLAQNDFTGPATILEGRFGFFNAFSYERTYEPTKVTEGLGQEFKFRHTSFKPYACCRFAHPALDATLKLVLDNDIKPDEVEAIDIETYEMAIVDLMEPPVRKYSPVTPVDAQFSLPYVIATAIYDRKVLHHQFTPEGIRRPHVLRLASKVHARERPEYTKAYPVSFPAMVRIKTTDGREHTQYVDKSTGDPDNPAYQKEPERWSREIESKFRNLTEPVLGTKRTDQVIGVVQRLERLDDIELVTSLIR